MIQTLSESIFLKLKINCICYRAGDNKCQIFQLRSKVNVVQESLQDFNSSSLQNAFVMYEKVLLSGFSLSQPSQKLTGHRNVFHIPVQAPKVSHPGCSAIQ